MTALLALLFVGLILSGGYVLICRGAAPTHGLALNGTLILAVVLVVGVAFSAAFGFGAWFFDLEIGLCVLVAILWRGCDFKAGDALPSKGMLAFLGVSALVFIAPTLVLPVPMDTDAQGFGYLALTVRDGGTLTTLAPFHPEIEYLYSPGFPVLIAYISSRTGMPIHRAQMALGATLGIIFIWLARDFGVEVLGERIGQIVPVTALIGTGLVTAYMDSHYTTLLALVFGLAFLTFALRALRGGNLADWIAASLTLAALPISHPDTTIIVAIGYIPWLIVLAVWWLVGRGGAPFTFVRLVKLAVGMPALALVLILPWLLRIAHLLGSDIASPFEVSSEHWKLLFFMHGVMVPILAAVGVTVAFRRLNEADLLMLVWMVAIVEFSTLGLLERIFPFMESVLKYDYPFSIAWHGPIIPYAYLAALGIAWLGDRVGGGRMWHLVERVQYPIMMMAALAVVAVVMFSGELPAISKGRPGFYGAFSSHADVEAMLWLRRNAPPDARILNYPANYEAHWAPVVSERDAVYFRPQPFYVGAEDAYAEQEELEAFWRDPSDPRWESVLEGHGIDYVLVPQIIGNPASWASMFRWRQPSVLPADSDVDDAGYLELVFERDGAAVYLLIDR